MKEVIKIFNLRSLMESEDCKSEEKRMICPVLIILLIILKIIMCLLIGKEYTNIAFMCIFLDAIMLLLCIGNYNNSGLCMGTPLEKDTNESFKKLSCFMPVKKTDIIKCEMMVWNFSMGFYLIYLLVGEVLYKENISFNVSSLIFTITVLAFSVCISKMTHIGQSRSMKIYGNVFWILYFLIIGFEILVGIVNYKKIEVPLQDYIYSNALIGYILCGISAVYLVLFTIHIFNKCKRNEISF